MDGEAKYRFNSGMRKEAGGSGRPISANPQIKPNKQEDHPPHDAERSQGPLLLRRGPALTQLVHRRRKVGGPSKRPLAGRLWRPSLMVAVKTLAANRG